MKLANLLYFDIGRNRIGGSIPEDIGTDFGDLKYFHINRNRLTGSIPDTIPLVADGRMISFLADHNRLGGAIPDNWLMFNKLVQYTLQGRSCCCCCSNNTRGYRSACDPKPCAPLTIACFLSRDSLWYHTYYACCYRKLFRLFGSGNLPFKRVLRWAMRRIQGRL